MIELNINSINKEIDVVRPKINHAVTLLMALVFTVIGAVTIDPTLSHGLGYKIMSGVTVIAYILNFLVIATIIKVITNLTIPLSLKIDNGRVIVKISFLTISLQGVTLHADENPKALPKSWISYYDCEDLVLLKIQSPKTALFVGVTKQDYENTFKDTNT